MRRTVFILVLFAILLACAPYRIVEVSEVNPRSKQHEYKTYDYRELIRDNSITYTADVTRLRNAIDIEMQSKGFRRDELNPDLWIVVGGALNEAVSTRQTSFNERPTGKYASWQSRYVEASHYLEEYVALAIVDPKESEMVWKGCVAGVLVISDKKMDSRMNTAIRELFLKFPLKPN